MVLRNQRREPLLTSSACANDFESPQVCKPVSSRNCCAAARRKGGGCMSRWRASQSKSPTAFLIGASACPTKWWNGRDRSALAEQGWSDVHLQVTLKFGANSVIMARDLKVGPLEFWFCIARSNLPSRLNSQFAAAHAAPSPAGHHKAAVRAICSTSACLGARSSKEIISEIILPQRCAGDGVERDLAGAHHAAPYFIFGLHHSTV